MLGVELGGSIKNVIAIAAGVVDGLGLGLNTRAALITRGMTEIRRLGVKLGANTRSGNLRGISAWGPPAPHCTEPDAGGAFAAVRAPCHRAQAECAPVERRD